MRLREPDFKGNTPMKPTEERYCRVPNRMDVAYVSQESVMAQLVLATLSKKESILLMCCRFACPFAIDYIWSAYIADHKVRVLGISKECQLFLVTSSKEKSMLLP